MNKIIGTHDGSFHLDEVMGCVMLCNYVEEFKDFQIVRTRDEEKLNQFKIVIDVGGIYNPENYRFDHHQKEFQDCFDANHQIRLSSAGLVYKHFGKEVIKNIAKIDNIQLNEQDLNTIYMKLYKDLIMCIDAIDNGVMQYETDLIQKYKINSSLHNRIGRCNRQWNDNESDQDQLFRKAMKIAENELLEQTQYLIKTWFPARDIVFNAIQNRFDVDKSGKIIKLSSCCPWKEYLYDIEKQLNLQDTILFVIFQTQADWRVQCVSQNQSSFLNRKSLKKEWCGVKDMQLLKQLSQIDDIVFCHYSGFIGGSKTYDSTLKMAQISMIE